ncbi:MAG: hypothetical protein ABIC04_04530 [Nanoarchaeota archaeon]
MINPNSLTNYLEHFTYVGIFLVLTFVGYIIPIPEEIILISIGYITALGFTKLYLVILLSIIAVVMGDSLLFYFGRI